MSCLNNYQNNTKNSKNVYDISFNLINVPLGLANSLRRVLLSNIPVTAFDDTWIDDDSKRSIVIKKNTSGLHNEFLAHRLSLIPICMYNNELFKIKTKFIENKRSFSFVKSVRPKFFIKIKNNSETRHQKNASGMIDVTSEDFEFLNESDTFPDSIDEFFPKNEITGDYIIINILKPNIIVDSEGEELEIECTPNIGYGEINSRYCSVGTVSFSFIEESIEVVEEVFKQKIKYKNKERKEKGLSAYNQETVHSIKKSFDILDKQRVYVQDKEGNPSQFKFRIESIGFLESHQLFRDSLDIIKLKLIDILNSFTIVENNKDIKLIVNNKLSINDSVDNLLGHEIDINNENHTIGNLINDYMKLLYTAKEPLDSNIITFASYKMPHPLKEQIQLKIKINPNINLNKIYTNLMFNFTGKYSSEINIPNTKNQVSRDIVLLLLVRTVSYIISDLDKLMIEWETITGIDSPSFVIDDEVEYLQKFKNIGKKFNTKDFDYGLEGSGSIAEEYKTVESESLLEITSKKNWWKKHFVKATEDEDGNPVE